MARAATRPMALPAPTRTAAWPRTGPKTLAGRAIPAPTKARERDLGRVVEW